MRPHLRPLAPLLGMPRNSREGALVVGTVWPWDTFCYPALYPTHVGFGSLTGVIVWDAGGGLKEVMLLNMHVTQIFTFWGFFHFFLWVINTGWFWVQSLSPVIVWPGHLHSRWRTQVHPVYGLHQITAHLAALAPAEVNVQVMGRGSFSEHWGAVSGTLVLILSQLERERELLFFLSMHVNKREKRKESINLNTLCISLTW